MPEGIRFLIHKKRKYMEVDTDKIKLGTIIRVKNRRMIRVGARESDWCHDWEGRRYSWMFKYLYYEIKCQ